MSVCGYDDLVERLTANSLSAERLIVTPLLHQDQVQAAAIDLRMGNLVMLVRSRGLSHVDPRDYVKSNSQTFQAKQNKQQKFQRHEIPFGQSFLLHPGTLALVPTFEWVRLPVDLQGVVTARSSWAREGLNIATANFINPLYEGIITLELANFGEIPIRLFPGLRLAQIAFYKVHKFNQSQSKKSQFNFNLEPSGGSLHDPAIDPPLPPTELEQENGKLKRQLHTAYQTIKTLISTSSAMP